MKRLLVILAMVGCTRKGTADIKQFNICDNPQYILYEDFENKVCVMKPNNGMKNEFQLISCDIINKCRSK